MYCKHCGKELDSEDKFCKYCGKEITEESPAVQENKLNDKTTVIDMPIFKENWLSYICVVFIMCSPIINSLITYLISVYGNNGILKIFSFVPMALLFVDWHYLKQYGIKGVWKILGILPLVYPVYLFIRAKKTNRKYVFGIVAVIIAVLYIIGIGLSEIIETNNTNNGMNTESYNTKIYDWEIDGYSVVQSEEINYVELEEYMPAYWKSYYYTQKNPSSTEDIITVENTSTRESGGVGFSREVPNSTISKSYGYYLYNEEYDCIYKIFEENALGNYGEEVCMFQINRSYTIDDSNEIASPPHLFTITTEAGVFEDCLCIVELEENTDGNYTTVNFYAPGVGLVLTECKDTMTESVFDTDGYVVTDELVAIEDF